MSYDYNEISKIYDDVRQADFEVIKFMINKLNINESSKVLEVGCGTANYLKLIHDLTKAEVWGVDQSQGMLHKAKEKCKSAVLIEDNASELSKLPVSAFDLVYMVDVIHHIKDIDKTFQSINRILKKDGSIVIFSDSHEHIRNRLTTKYFPETLDPELKRYQDTSEIIGSLSNSGFNNTEYGSIEIGKDYSYGSRLIEIASKKGYSMFGMISDEAIQRGIERIRKDMLEGPVVYHQSADYVLARKR